MLRPLIIALAAIAVLVAAVARPPGVMAVASDSGITYEICSEGALRIVTIAPDGSPTDAPEGERTEGATLCKFFAVHAALPAPTDAAVPSAPAAGTPWIRAASSAPLPSALRRRHPPRAPPAV